MKLFAFALPDAGLRPIELGQIRRSKSDNDILYADRDDIEVDGTAISGGDLSQSFAALRAIAADMGAELRAETDTSLFFVWRSPTVGFPNGAYAYASAQDDGDVRISFYGRALYGRRDFGANKAFIDRLAAAL